MRKRLMVLGCALTLCVGGLLVVLVMRTHAEPLPAPHDEPAKVAKELPPEAPPKSAENRITHVTVYTNSALVTREVDVPAGAGPMELVVTPLPQQTLEGSLYSEGTEGIRVLTTRFRSRPVLEDTREEVRKLEDQAHALQLAGQKIQGDLWAVRENMGLLAKVENFTAASTQNATEKGKLDSDATIALAKYLSDGRTEKSKELVALQQQAQANAEQAEFVQRKLKAVSSGSLKVDLDAVLVVEKTNAAAGKVRLNYLVDQASWQPQYKIRAGAGEKDPVQVEYLAAVVQQTGEDWSNVVLTLSNAEPMLYAAPPELQRLAVALVPKSSVNVEENRDAFGPGRVQFGQLGGGLQLGGARQIGQLGGGLQVGMMPAVPGPIPNPEGATTSKEISEQIAELRQQAQSEINRKNKDVGKDIWNYAGALDQARDLALDDAPLRGKGAPGRASKIGGPTVAYHLATKLTVPSRSEEQVLEVARLEMAPDFFYKAVPVLTAHVYKQANLTNKSKFVLLPGEATMYNGSDFVGRMDVPLVAVGEQFTVGFGVDSQLQVHRQMTDKTRAYQGGNQILTYDYRLVVSSYKTEKVRLQAWDRLPAAESETMAVTLAKSAPEVSKDALYLREERPHNLLRWDLDVDPDANGEKALAVQYQFKLEWSKEMTFGTFQTK